VGLHPLGPAASMRPALSFVQGAFPIKLLYTSMLPLIVLSAFQGVVYLTSQVSSREPPPTPRSASTTPRLPQALYVSLAEGDPTHWSAWAVG